MVHFSRGFISSETHLITPGDQVCSIGVDGRPRSFTPWLIALLVLIPLGAAALLVAVIPLAECPQPRHRNPHGGAWGKYLCFRCKDSGRVTLLNKWRDGTDRLEYWEGMEISTINQSGFVKTNAQRGLNIAGIRIGMRMTDRLRKDAWKELWETGSYESVDLRVRVDLTMPGKVVLELVVKEN